MDRWIALRLSKALKKPDRNKKTDPQGPVLEAGLGIGGIGFDPKSCNGCYAAGF
ncbi:MAG: hypothetical protein H6975_00640 [Gammaproteobacteria bacterium]|nr:hypothetical protein [Gammaproteobacteria bacterium]